MRSFDQTPASCTPAFPNPVLQGLDLLASPVLIADAALRLHYLNPAAQELFCIGSAQVEQKSLRDLLGEVPDLAAALHGVSRHQWERVRQNIVLEQQGQNHHYDCSISAIELDVPCVLLEFWPLDAQLKTVREERMSEQQHVSRELIRNLAHEIKNPLGGIRGSAQLLQAELAEPALHEYTQVIIAEVDRLHDLMRRLLDGHRRMRPATINIHDVLTHVRKLIEAEFPTVQWHADYDISLPELWADREQIIQAVLNIVRNAAQAMAGQGTVVLRTRALRQITWAKRRHKLALELQIIDNGPGIAPELLDKIFYPLVSGRPEGSGLGLSIAESFIEQHHGMIDVGSEPGRTCFTIFLPIDRTV